MNAYWIVDNMVSYMPKVIEAYNKHEFEFFVVEICVNKKHKGYMEIYTEDSVEGVYKDHIQILKQDIEFVDLPLKDNKITTYKFFL